MTKTFDETAHPRSGDGTFTTKQRPEAADIHLDDAASRDRHDSTTWPYDFFPAQAAYEDLPRLIEGYWAANHYRLPEVEGATFTLVHNFGLDQIASPADLWMYAVDHDPDDEDYELAMADSGESVESYEELQAEMAARPWNVPPLVVVVYGETLDEGLEEGRYEVLDGNHRSGLGLAVGARVHPAYVLLVNPGATPTDTDAAAAPLPHQSANAATMMANFAPVDGPDWNALRAEYETEHPVVMAALREDMAANGMKTPVVVRDAKIENGQHRILAAADVGVPVKWRLWDDRLDADPAKKQYWDPETRRHYGPDEDEHGEGQLRY